jgi:hypothetical protein
MLPRAFGSVVLVGLLATAGALLAHDKSLHKGRPTEGQVVSVVGDRLDLKTAQGLKKVTLTEETKFERGDKAAARADLKKGEQVTVFGTTLATGEIVGNEVLLATPRTGATQQHKEGH